jgi:hypothetical protein
MHRREAVAELTEEGMSTREIGEMPCHDCRPLPSIILT